MKKNKIIIALCSGLLLFGCQNLDETGDLIVDQAVENEVVYSDFQFPLFEAKIEGINARTLPSEYKLKVYMAEYITASGSQEMGRTVVFDNKGSKQLSADFSPFAKLYDTPDMSYYVDETRPSSYLDVSESTGAIDRAAMTWDEAICSDINMTKIPSDNIELGFISGAFGFGGSTTNIKADVNHLGFLPIDFFTFFFGPSGNNVLAATFTLIWTDGNGDPVDTNGDGKRDVAVREIYYNESFAWAVDGNHFDLETVALHEMGHGLSQAHFGTGFFKQNGEVQFSPRAVMNATYSGIQTEIGKTDLAGHCSIWGNWPNK